MTLVHAEGTKYLPPDCVHMLWNPPSRLLVESIVEYCMLVGLLNKSICISSLDNSFDEGHDMLVLNYM